MKRQPLPRPGRAYGTIHLQPRGFLIANLQSNNVSQRDTHLPRARNSICSNASVDVPNGNYDTRVSSERRNALGLAGCVISSSSASLKAIRFYLRATHLFACHTCVRSTLTAKSPRSSARRAPMAPCRRIAARAFRNASVSPRSAARNRFKFGRCRVNLGAKLLARRRKCRANDPTPSFIPVRASIALVVAHNSAALARAKSHTRRNLGALVAFPTPIAPSDPPRVGAMTRIAPSPSITRERTARERSCAAHGDECVVARPARAGRRAALKPADRALVAASLGSRRVRSASSRGERRALEHLRVRWSE